MFFFFLRLSGFAFLFYFFQNYFYARFITAKSERDRVNLVLGGNRQQAVIFSFENFFRFVFVFTAENSKQILVRNKLASLLFFFLHFYSLVELYLFDNNVLIDTSEKLSTKSQVLRGNNDLNI